MISSETAVVLGAAGQDGHFLCQHLVSRGYRVVGLGHRASPLDLPKGTDYQAVDVRDSGHLARVLDELMPDLVFHVAAVHGSAGTPYESVWQDMLAVNTGSVHVVMEYLRTTNPAGQLVYASSGKVFSPAEGIINEQSHTATSCLYTVTKLASRDVIELYRRKHGLKASVVHLFNHESERRPAHFFVPKMVSAVARAIQGGGGVTEVDSLDFYCDWGSANEYMDLVVDIARHEFAEDFVIGSGVTWHGRQFVEELFGRHGFDYSAHIEERVSDRCAGPRFVVSTEKLSRLVGRSPREDILSVCDRMLTTHLQTGTTGS